MRSSGSSPPNTHCLLFQEFAPPSFKRKNVSSGNQTSSRSIGPTGPLPPPRTPKPASFSCPTQIACAGGQHSFAGRFLLTPTSFATTLRVVPTLSLCSTASFRSALLLSFLHSMMSPFIFFADGSVCLVRFFALFSTLRAFSSICFSRKSACVGARGRGRPFFSRENSQKWKG